MKRRRFSAGSFNAADFDMNMIWPNRASSRRRRSALARSMLPFLLVGLFPAARTPIRACDRGRSSNLINAISVEVISRENHRPRRAGVNDNLRMNSPGGGTPPLELFWRTRVGVGFYFAPLLFNNTAQLSLHRFESVVDHFVERFVRAVVHLSFVGHQFVPA
jgi:hypothetical protein